MDRQLRERYEEVTRLAEGLLSSERGEAEDERVASFSAALEELYVLAETVDEQQRELEQAMSELRGLHERYAGLFNLCPDVYLVTDMNGIISEANEAVQEVLGRSPDQLEGTPLAGLIKEEHRPGFHFVLESVRHSSDGQIRGAEFTIQSQGVTRDVLVDVTCGGPEDDRELRWLIRDTTEWKRLHAAAREVNTPVLPISPRTLLVPLVGAIDRIRMADTEEVVLNGIAAHRAESVVFDMTGVPQIDNEAVEAFVNVTEAARLLGAKVTISGVSSAVSESLVLRSRLPMGAVSFVGNLSDAVSAALQRA